MHILITFTVTCIIEGVRFTLEMHSASLTLLLSKRQKLNFVLAVLSAVGLSNKSDHNFVISSLITILIVASSYCFCFAF